jgi:hypothetical protein
VYLKGVKKQIDLDKKKVIEQLQKNSNEGIDTRGKKYGFFWQNVWRFIKRPENNKTIWGVHCDSNIGETWFKALYHNNQTIE